MLDLRIVDRSPEWTIMHLFKGEEGGIIVEFNGNEPMEALEYETQGSKVVETTLLTTNLRRFHVLKELSAAT